MYFPDSPKGVKRRQNAPIDAFCAIDAMRAPFSAMKSPFGALLRFRDKLSFSAVSG